MTVPKRYTYRAVTRGGDFIHGQILATSEEKVIASLTQQQLFPVTVRVVSAFIDRKVRIPIADLAIGFRILANLIESGLPIGKALGAFRDLAPMSWESAVDPIRDSVRNGKTLAAALGESSLAIPPTIIGILHAGEVGAGLGPAVRRSADLMDRTAATRAAVRNALAYPIILMIAGMASLGLLVGIVLPKFSLILHDLGQTLPRTTQIVIDTSMTVRRFSIPTLIMGIVIWLVMRIWLGTQIGRLQWHRWLLKLPGIGTLRLSRATASTAAAMSSLLESGIPITSALSFASRASGDTAIEYALRKVRERVVEGERLGVALADARALSDTAVRLVRAGEESGRVAQMLNHVATIEQERVEQRVRAIVRLLEPGLILVFGGVVAFVAAALLQAVYSVRPSG